MEFCPDWRPFTRNSTSRGESELETRIGRAKAIRFSTLERLCEVLDCQPSDLLSFEKGSAQTTHELRGSLEA